LRIGTGTPEQFDALMRAEYEKYARLVETLRREAGLICCLSPPHRGGGARSAGWFRSALRSPAARFHVLADFPVLNRKRSDSKPSKNAVRLAS